MTFAQLFAILRGRWRGVAGICLCTALCTAAISQLMTRQYTAVASVLVDPHGPEPLERDPVSTQNLMATQIDLIASERVARKVVTSLDEAWRKQAFADWREETEGRGDASSFAAQQLLAKLDARPQKDSSVIKISFTHPDAKFAARVANAFATAYIDTSLELKVEPARRFAEWFDERTQGVRDNLESAQARLSAFQRQHGVLPDGQVDVENAKLTELTTQLIETQGQRMESASRQIQVSRNADASPDVIKSPVVTDLRTRIAHTEANVAQIGKKFGENHPLLRSASAELAALKAQLRTETQIVAQSLGLNNSVNLRRETEILAALERQRQKVLTMSKHANELAVLKRDVENAQQSLDLVAARQTQTALESKMQQTNVAVLTPSTEPAFPSRPKMLLNTLLGAALGFLLGMGRALASERRAPILRDPDDLLDVLDLPPLATTLSHVSYRPLRLTKG